MAKNKHILLFLSLFLIILSTYVSAYYTVELGEYYGSTKAITRGEFKVHTGAYDVCSGVSQTIPIWIKDKVNTNQFEFKLQNIGYVELSGKSFTLAPEQDGVLFVKITPPINIEKVTSLNLDIYTNGKLTLRLPIELNIKNCYKVDVSWINKQDTICACDSYNYEVEIENKGNYDEIFNLFLDAPSFVNMGTKFIDDTNKSITITEKLLSINSGNKSVQNINVITDCNISGNFIIRAYAELERGEMIKDYDDLSLRIVSKEDCLKSDLVLGDITVEYSKHFYPVKVKNTGIKQIEYQLSLDAPAWMSLENNNFILDPDQQEEIYLVLDPSPDLVADNYNVTLLLNA
ncbi:MAG: hypothetical protein ABIJ08_05235, partial [Nanoarchaeota archaeon]